MGTKNATEIIGTATLAVLAITTAAFVVACGGGDETSTGQLDGIAQATRSTAAPETTPTTIAPAALSTEEASSRVFMREEEELARDVYAAMFSLWVGNVYQNIGAGEQVHMDAAKLLRTRCSLPEPAATTLPGQFANTMLQGPYDALVASGQLSLVAALQASAETKELDIRDLQAIEPTIDNADLLLVYENLEKDSRNHLRAFHDSRLRQDASYTLKCVTQNEHDAIVNSPKENE